MSSVTVLQAPSNATMPTSTATTTIGPFQGGVPARKPAPINPLAQTCHKCGADLTHSHIAADAQRRISELEAQVKMLTTKATAAVDKLADYEDELRYLKSTNSTTGPDLDPSQDPQSLHQQRQNSSSPRPPPPPPPQASSSARTFPSRLTSLVSTSSKRSQSQPPSKSATGTPQPSTPLDPSQSQPGSSPIPTATQLQALLTHEQSLRLAAERRVTQTNSELEELSAQLFTEANEMVATERKARAKLEQRVEILEKREKEKVARLEMLEKRIGRVERVRGILANGVPAGGAGVGAIGTTTLSSSPQITTGSAPQIPPLSLGATEGMRLNTGNSNSNTVGVT